MPKSARKKEPASKTTTTKKTKPAAANDQEGEKVCTWCHQRKSMTDFYFSSSPMYSLDGRVPFCKECCKSYPLHDDGSINYFKFKDLLMKIDKPLYYDILDRSISSVAKQYSYATEADISRKGTEILGRYFRMIVMRQTRDKSYSDSEREGYLGQVSGKTKQERNELVLKYGAFFEKGKDDLSGSSVGLAIDDFVVTPEMIELFGDGYTVAEYKKMYEKYESLRKNYQIQTSLHQEALLTYVRFKVKEEAATVEGRVDEAKKWYNAAQDAADKAKLSPKQLTKADLQKGLNSFSEISQAMEQAVDIIEILPRYKSQPVDSVDFNIWCYINYARRLKGLPVVEYSDVYKFYDVMKEDYISQYGDPYGIFTDDTTIKNRENVEKFITLPADYNDTDADDEGDEDE